MNDLNSRIRQLTKLILTSQTVDENKDNESRPASPTKVDFDMSPYQVRQGRDPSHTVSLRPAVSAATGAPLRSEAN